MKKKMIKTIFRIIYFPLGLCIFASIAGIIMAITGIAEPLPTIPGCVIMIIVLGLIAIPISKLEKKLTGEK